MKKLIIMAALCSISMVIFKLNNSCAQDETHVFKCDKEGVPKLIITREAKVEAEPDKATINIRILSEEAKVEKAFDKNKEKMNTIIQTLKQEGIEEKDIKTIEYHITPLYQGKSARKPTSYIVDHGIKVNIFKLDIMEKILKEISGIESVNVYRLEFACSNIEELKKEALKKAARLAKETALSLVEAAGGKLGRVLRIQESSAEPFYGPKRSREEAYILAEKEAIDTAAKVEPGTLEILGRCTVIYEIEK